MIKSKNEAFALHCGLDYSEAKDYRYHYGRTTQPVWAINDEYYCITKVGQKPAEHRNTMEWNWVLVADELLNQNGFQIWCSKS